MAQTIKLKRSANATLTSGQGIPTTSNLELGEVAINTYHGKMYIKKNDGSESIVEVGAADTTKLPLAGGTMTGAINMGGNNLTNLATLSTASGNLKSCKICKIITTHIDGTSHCATRKRKFCIVGSSDFYYGRRPIVFLNKDFAVIRVDCNFAEF